MFLKNKFFWIFVFLIAIIFCVIRYNPYKIRSMLKSTAHFALNSCNTESKNIKSYPSNFNLLLNKLKLLLLFSIPDKSTNVAGFKVYFRDPLQINCLFDEIFDFKCYYFETQKIDPFIIDCGSNIGTSVLFFKLLYPKSKILAFEPTSTNFELLNKNISENNLDNITTIKMALSNKKGKATFYNPGWEGGSLNLGTGSSKTEEVAVTTLSDYIDQEVDLLKIDIEGGETDVFDDLAKNNKLSFIKEIIFEYHNCLDASSSNKLAKILKFLDDNKFEFIVNGIASNGIVFSPTIKKKYQTFLIYAFRKA
jgi:FkbM family methyltransferase